MMIKRSLIILTVMATVLQISYVSVAQRSMETDNEVEYEKPDAEPVSTPTPEPSSTKTPKPDTNRPFPKGTPVTTETVDPVNKSPNVDPVKTTTTTTKTTTTTTTPSGSGVNYGNQLNRDNDGVGGASNDIEAPTPLEDQKFIKESLVQDGVYEKKRLKERQVLRYDDIREADVLWSKRVWRVIDTREKMNLTFSYPEQPFVGILLDIISKSDEAKIFTDDDFTLETSSEEILQRLGSVEEIQVYNPITEEMETQVVSNEFNPELITKIRIKEDWVFDEEASTMAPRPTSFSITSRLVCLC